MDGFSPLTPKFPKFSLSLFSKLSPLTILGKQEVKSGSWDYYRWQLQYSDVNVMILRMMMNSHRMVLLLIWRLYCPRPIGASFLWVFNLRLDRRPARPGLFGTPRFGPRPSQPGPLRAASLLDPLWPAWLRSVGAFQGKLGLFVRARHHSLLPSLVKYCL